MKNISSTPRSPSAASLVKNWPKLKLVVLTTTRLVIGNYQSGRYDKGRRGAVHQPGQSSGIKAPPGWEAGWRAIPRQQRCFGQDMRGTQSSRTAGTQVKRALAACYCKSLCPTEGESKGRHPALVGTTTLQGGGCKRGFSRKRSSEFRLSRFPDSAFSWT